MSDNVESKSIFPQTGLIWGEGGSFTKSEIHVENGIIRLRHVQTIDEETYIIPPFCDPHVHGGWGLSFQDAEFGPLEEELKSRGILWAVPTLMNDSLENLKRIVSEFKMYKQGNPDSIFPYLRLEGPFINPEKKGIQSVSSILDISPSNVNAILELDEIKVLTFAPEIHGVEGFVAKAMERDKILSIGHSDAGIEELDAVLKMGVNHMTHFPNAMRTLHHRDVGLMGAGLLREALQLEMICDEVHTSFDFIHLVLKMRGPEFSAASDMVPPAGIDGKEFDGKAVRISGRRITDEHGTIAGGSMTVPEQAKLLRERGVPEEEVLRITCTNALRFFGEKSPSLREGQTANFLICNRDLTVHSVFYKGSQIK
ncbi:amidohydrolase family protein [Acidobacteriota bacterium]